tara:strand:+ start:661 stop:1545 length:885 start_codon:yes stop_codon:yes gene_type:complete
MLTTDWKFSDQGCIAAPGGKIWYGIVGEMEPQAKPLLAIHGGPGMSHHYLYPLVDLSDRNPVVFYDQLDAGQSERPNDPANWKIERFLLEIDAIRDSLGLEQISIFGNSWGGTVAAAYAATRPAGLEKLVLSSPLLNTARWISDNTLYREALPLETQKIMLDCESKDETDSKAYEAAVEEFYKRHLCRSDPWPSYLNETFETMNMVCYAGMWGPNEFTCNGILKDYDGTVELALIDARTLVTFGEYDEATPKSCREYATAIPDAVCAEFKGSSHLAFIEDREKYVSTVRRFLSE